MADRSGMEMRLLRASLWRRRNAALLAIGAVAIGVSVASALLHLSSDLTRKLSRELRQLGPNLLVVPEARRVAQGGGLERDEAAGRYLDVATVRARLEPRGLPVAPLLYVVARAPGGAIQLIGADLAAARALHPAWSVEPDGGPTLMGARLRARLSLAPGAPLTVTLGGRSLTLPAGPTLGAGGADDDAWWIPLADAQRLSGLPGQASVVQSRLPATAPLESLRGLDLPGEFRVLPLHALSDTEAGLLARMKRLMTLVTLAALLAAGLCAFGTLTDLALERRREIALMKSLGAAQGDIVRVLCAESAVIGLLGGLSGWLLGLLFAELIGREVFHTAIAVRWEVPPIVLGLALLVAAVSSLGPIRMALAVEPARVLKGE
jgi:putative ABC transport system permease protein